MGRIKKQQIGKIASVPAEARKNDETKTTSWVYLWGFLVAVLSVFIAIIWGITFYSSTPVNASNSDDLNIDGSYVPLSSRSKTSVYRTGKVKLKTLSSPYARFAKNCAKAGTPVVLKDSVVKTWQAFTNWTPAYLRSKLGLLWGIYENDNRWFGPYFDATKPLAGNATRHNTFKTGITMGAGEFFDLLHNPKKGKYHYYTRSIDDMAEWAYSEIQPLNELLLLNQKVSSVNVWIGQPYVIAHCHYDGYHNFYAQLYGRKKFTLFSPTNWPGLYPFPFLHPSHAQAQVNASNQEDVEKFSLVRDVEAMKVILEPGDLLYIPPLWFHEVESLSTSISVNVWTDSYQTELMLKVFSMPLPFESSDVSSHGHEHLEWRGPHERRIGTAVFIHRILDKICEHHACADAESDKFFKASTVQKTKKQYSPSAYFVFLLWRTRYKDLMRIGELPDILPNKTDILCESGKSEDVELTLKADTDIMKDVHYGSYIELVGLLVKGLPKETWPLWIGNFVEYVAVSAVSEAKYVGIFLEHFNSCTKYLS